jgi:endo-1,4-beta-D-glucanase Y
MLTEIYIAALDEELADQVWEAWDVENLTDGAACIAWMLIAASRQQI